VIYVVIIAASLLVYTNPSSITMFTIAFAALWLCPGGWLAIVPAKTTSYFGTKDYARDYGLAFTAYGVSAIIGNLMAGAAKDMLGGYVNVFPYVAVLAALGIVVVFVMDRPPQVGLKPNCKTFLKFSGRSLSPAYIIYIIYSDSLVWAARHFSPGISTGYIPVRHPMHRFSLGIPTASTRPSWLT